MSSPFTVDLEPVRTYVVCPACIRQIHVDLGLPSIDDDGHLVVDDAPLHRALGLHLSYGCPRARRVQAP